MNSLPLFALLLAATIFVAAAPAFRQFKSGLQVSVTRGQPRGFNNPSFNVTFYNPTQQNIETASHVREFLSQADELGPMIVTSDDPGYRPHTTSAFQDFSIQVPAMCQRVYVFTRRA